MEVKIKDTILTLVQGDITQEATDAIVNAANAKLIPGGGVDGAIHRAGGPTIYEECRKIGGCAPGKAVITSGGNLKAKYVIHTVGPIYRGGKSNEAEILASAYRESLRIAQEKGLKSISFPAISTGAYGYPLEEAAHIALKTTISFLEGEQSLKLVRFVLFDRKTFDIFEVQLKNLLPPSP